MNWEEVSLPGGPTFGQIPQGENSLFPPMSLKPVNYSGKAYREVETESIFMIYTLDHIKK